MDSQNLKCLVNNLDGIRCKKPKLKKQSTHGGVFHVSKLEYEGGPLAIVLAGVKVLSGERENVVCIKLQDTDIANVLDIEAHICDSMLNRLEITDNNNFVSNVAVSNGRGKVLKCAFAAKYPCIASARNRVCDVVLQMNSIKYSEHASRIEWTLVSFDEISPLDSIKSNEHSESETEDDCVGPSSDDIKEMHVELMGRLDQLIDERRAQLYAAINNRQVLLQRTDITDINRIASELV